MKIWPLFWRRALKASHVSLGAAWLGAVKWAATLLYIGFGAFFLGPWIDSMAELARESGALAYDDPRFADARRNVILWGAIQTVALCALVFVSIYKPWGRRDRVASTR